VVQSKTGKVVTELGDAASGLTFLGILADAIPLALGVLGILWYVLRFINWFRVNHLDKESWKGM